MSDLQPLRVLVVEDGPDILHLIRYSLQQHGILMEGVTCAEDARASLRQQLPDAVLLDWMLPGISGLKLLAELRATPRTRDLPVLMLTARGEEDDRVTGLEHGADDFIVKPFSPRELVARLHAVLRRRTPYAADCDLAVGPLRLNPARHEVLLNGVAINLSYTEFRLLAVLMSHPQRVFNRPQLLDRVWGEHSDIEDRTVDVHILRLRKSLGPEGEHLIETVRGVGYRIRASE